MNDYALRRMPIAGIVISVWKFFVLVLVLIRAFADADICLILGL